MFEVDVKNVTEEGRRGPARVWGSDYLNKIKEYKISQMNKYKIILIKILNVK